MKNLLNFQFLGETIHLKLAVGYQVMASILMILDVLVAGTKCYKESPIVTGTEWRLGLYRHSRFLNELLFDMCSPIERPEFLGEFGLYHMLDVACQIIVKKVSTLYYEISFSMPNLFLTSEFYILRKKIPKSVQETDS